MLSKTYCLGFGGYFGAATGKVYTKPIGINEVVGNAVLPQNTKLLDHKQESLTQKVPEMTA